jgi:hypothetical protein
MPHRVIGLWMVLVGVLGVILVAALNPSPPGLRRTITRNQISYQLEQKQKRAFLLSNCGNFPESRSSEYMDTSGGCPRIIY